MNPLHPIYDAATIANEFLSRSERDGMSVDPMKLQKLLYVAQGWFLAFRHRPLFSDSFEAWDYGPVIPSIYREFRKYRSAPIQGLHPVESQPVDEDANALIDEVWSKYRRFTAIQLSMLTHEPGYAWDQTRKLNPWDSSPQVPNALIEDEFERRLQQPA